VESGKISGGELAPMVSDCLDLDAEVELIGAQTVPYKHRDRLREDDPLINTMFEVAPTYTARRQLLLPIS